MVGFTAKQSLPERDICSKFITPAIVDAGWDLHTQVREELSFTSGRVIVRGRLVTRGKSKRADNVLYFKPNIPLAVIEAKDNKHSVGDGMPPALEYAEMLDVPFVFSSNGDGFLEHDRTGKAAVVERSLELAEFPSPTELWSRYRDAREITPAIEPVVTQDYHAEPNGKPPRYYQVIAINRAIEAIAGGQRRILLVLATGTGKTFTAFQIIWRLWKSKARKRILFLADRNILVDQTRTNDFKPFGKAMTKITDRKVDKSYEVYLALYQASDIFKQFSPDFFDLIVVDECHRGSAAEDSAWREVLAYFAAATQIGLTATPEQRHPVIVTTSKLMSTGVDAQTCKVVVLDQTIRSMTEFKQIIGRGTRIREDFGKLFFTILDFKRATELFADPEFDGLPAQVFSPSDNTAALAHDADDGALDGGASVDSGDDGTDAGSGRVRYVVGDVPVQVLRERVQYYGSDGKLVTESLHDFARSMIRERYGSLDDFLLRWREADRKQAVVTELEERGLLFEAVAECVTNMMFHGIDVPSNIRHDNTLARPLRDYGPKDRVDVIVTNPPFGGMEEDGIESNFPAQFRTRETADLFLVLLVTLLKPGDRAALVLPDGTLFGEGIKTRVKEMLMTECNLHTIVRLPRGVFAPYTGIKTNCCSSPRGKRPRRCGSTSTPTPRGRRGGVR